MLNNASIALGMQDIFFLKKKNEGCIHLVHNAATSYDYMIDLFLHWLLSERLILTARY